MRQHPSLGNDISDAVAEQRADVILLTPQRRWLRTGRGCRSVRLHRGPQLPDVALGRPADQTDPAARFAHPNQLAGRELMERREHHADRGHHHVEFVVPEGQFMGVGLAPFEVDAALGGQAATLLQQFRHQVAGDDARSGLCGGNRRVSGACGHVEDAVARRDAGGLHQHGAERARPVRRRASRSRPTPTWLDVWPPPGCGRRRRSDCS